MAEGLSAAIYCLWIVVDAIAHLSGREESTGEVYQLCDQAPPAVSRFVEVPPFESYVENLLKSARARPDFGDVSIVQRG